METGHREERGWAAVLRQSSKAAGGTAMVMTCICAAWAVSLSLAPLDTTEEPFNIAWLETTPNSMRNLLSQQMLIPRDDARPLQQYKQPPPEERPDEPKPSTQDTKTREILFFVVKLGEGPEGKKEETTVTRKLPPGERPVVVKLTKDEFEFLRDQGNKIPEAGGDSSDKDRKKIEPDDVAEMIINTAKGFAGGDFASREQKPASSAESEENKGSDKARIELQKDQEYIILSLDPDQMGYLDLLSETMRSNTGKSYSRSDVIVLLIQEAMQDKAAP